MVRPQRFSALRLLTSISHSCNSVGGTQLQPRLRTTEALRVWQSSASPPSISFSSCKTHKAYAQKFPARMHQNVSVTPPPSCMKKSCRMEETIGSFLKNLDKQEEIQPVHPKGNKSWIFIGRTDAEADTPILWPPDAKSWLIGKDPDAGKDWRQEEKGTTEDEMAGWHHRRDGYEFE